jgi:hypothetical protein
MKEEQVISFDRYYPSGKSLQSLNVVSNSNYSTAMSWP